jgi:predicted phosphodiesterase
MGGINEYNWTIASRRSALFFEQIVKYKPQYRDQTEVVLLVNGDIIAGMIHNTEWFVDLLTTQFAGTLSILCQGISYLAQNFKKVRVVMTPGNHGRSMHKADQGRGTTHKWDSYETQIFIAVREVMKAKCPNVEVDVPDSPFAIFKAQGHTYFVTHSDTVINVGNPGSALNMKSINNQINKLNASEIGGDAKFDAVICGHIHTPTLQLMESGCMLVLNGCLSGLDPYALSIGIFDSNPTQQLFEATAKHAVGDVRFIQVKEADKDASLDKIIAAPKRPY